MVSENQKQHGRQPILTPEPPRPQLPETPQTPAEKAASDALWASVFKQIEDDKMRKVFERRWEGFFESIPGKAIRWVGKATVYVITFAFIYWIGGFWFFVAWVGCALMLPVLTWCKEDGWWK